MTNSKNLPASDLLKKFIQDRRDIADKLTSKNWVADGQYVVVPRDGEIPWEEVVVECSEEPSVAGNVAAFIADAHSHYIMLLRIIEVQDAALEFISPKIPHPARDLFRSREMIIAAEARERVEALLSNPKEQEKE